MNDDPKPPEGGIHFGNDAHVNGDVFTGGKREINTGGGAYVEGSVNTAGGDFVGRDQTKTTGLSAAEVAKLFEPIYARVEARANTSEDTKADIKAELQDVQTEVTKGDQADETFLARRLRNLERMAPDILQVVTATLSSPAAGIAAVISKVAGKMSANATGGH